MYIKEFNLLQTKLIYLCLWSRFFCFSAYRKLTLKVGNCCSKVFNNFLIKKDQRKVTDPRHEFYLKILYPEAK
jgi:hypothetical protein